MANNPRTVGIRYQTSDFLKDRFPYQVEKSFHAHPEKYRGRVFDGFNGEGIQRLFDQLPDPSVDVGQKVLALRYLHAHSAGQEAKIILLRQGLLKRVLPLVSASSPAPIDAYVARLLHSVAIVPQGSHAVVADGGLQSLITIISKIRTAEGDSGEEPSAEAAKAIAQIALTWEGRGWLLKIDVPEGLSLKRAEREPVGDAADEGVVAPDAAAAGGVSDQLSHDPAELFRTLVAYAGLDHAPREGVRHALDALANLSVEEEGLRYLLDANGVEVISAVLARYAEPSWIRGCPSPAAVGVLSVRSAATAIWHAGLFEVGRARAATVADLVTNITSVLHTTMANTAAEEHLALKAAISGGACALMLHPSLKAAALQAVSFLPGAPSLVDVLLLQIRQANALFAPIYKRFKSGEALQPNEPHPETIKPIMKNCVQALRLITEFPRATEYLLQALRGPEDAELRRQLYASTAFEQRFGVVPL